MSWNPAQYLKFQSARLRPALDLLARTIPAVQNRETVKRVLDLGCGPGNVTPFLAEAFPNAIIEGVDSSDKMIDQANKFRASTADSALRERLSFRVNSIENELDIADQKYDVVYANASLHWCLNHQLLFPSIVEKLLHPNGAVFAVQMPDTRNQPSHLLMETAALRSGMLDRLQHLRIPRTEQDPQWYFDFLNPVTKEIEMWSTEYVEQLSVATRSGDMHNDSNANLNRIQRHPVHEFTRATGLLPIVQALGGNDTSECQEYLIEYDRLLSEAYPQTVIKNKFHLQGKTVTLFPFKRFFLVCKT
jgi:trans-aconitate 2-methyltransferase